TPRRLGTPRRRGRGHTDGTAGCWSGTGRGRSPVRWTRWETDGPASLSPPRDCMVGWVVGATKRPRTLVGFRGLEAACCVSVRRAPGGEPGRGVLVIALRERCCGHTTPLGNSCHGHHEGTVNEG